MMRSDYAALFLSIVRDRKELGETKDCTVLAAALVAQIPYKLAHQIAKESGRPDNEGWYTDKVTAKMTQFGYTMIRVNFTGTLAKFIKENPIGRFYVNKNGHALAVIDGFKSDKTGGQAKLTRVYRLVDEEF